MQAPFAARCQQTIGDQHEQHLIPIRPFAAHSQPLRPELIELQFAPQHQCQPARAPLPRGQRIGAATVALGLAEGAYELGLAYTPTRIGSAGHGLAGSAPMFSLSYVTSGRRPDIAKEINSWTISNDSLSMADNTFRKLER